MNETANEAELPPVKHDETVKTNGFLTDMAANIIATLVLLCLGYIIMKYSFSTWSEAIVSGSPGILDIDFQSLSKADQNNFMCLAVLFIGSLFIGLIYMNKHNRKHEDSLIDHVGHVYSWLKWLIIPIEIINYSMTKDIGAIFFIPFACMLVFIAPAVIFGFATWIVSRCVRQK